MAIITLRNLVLNICLISFGLSSCLAQEADQSILLYKLDGKEPANFDVKLQYEDGNHYNLIKNKKPKSS